MKCIEDMKATVQKLIEAGAEREAKYISGCIAHVEADLEYQEMVSKNTPKKPIYIKIIKPGWYECPNCNIDFMSFSIGNHHCERCGQKLDWSE